MIQLFPLQYAVTHDAVVAAFSLSERVDHPLFGHNACLVIIVFFTCSVFFVSIQTLEGRDCQLMDWLHFLGNLRVK